MFKRKRFFTNTVTFLGTDQILPSNEYPPIDPEQSFHENI